MPESVQSIEIRQCKLMWDICVDNYVLELEKAKSLLARYEKSLSEIKIKVELLNDIDKDSMLLKQKELMMQIIALRASLNMLTNVEYMRLSIKEAYLKMYESMLSSSGLLVSIGYLEPDEIERKKINRIYPNGDRIEGKNLDDERMLISRKKFDFAFNNHPILKESDNLIIKTRYEKNSFYVYLKMNGDFIRIGQVFLCGSEDAVRENGDISCIISDKRFEKYGYELINLILEILNEYGIYNIRLCCREPNSFEYRYNEGWELMKKNFFANYQGKISLVETDSKVYEVSTIKLNQKNL